MRALYSFCTDLNDGQEPLLAQGLRDFTDALQSKEGQDVYSKCIITLPHPVKSDFAAVVTELLHQQKAPLRDMFWSFDRTIGGWR